MTGEDLGRVERIGDTVHRPVAPWTAAVHDLLLHLEAVGYERAPRVLGFDNQGREVLTWITGDSGPESWGKVVDDKGLIAFARAAPRIPRRRSRLPAVGFGPLVHQDTRAGRR